MTREINFIGCCCGPDKSGSGGGGKGVDQGNL